jgi:hypothetical protein
MPIQNWQRAPSVRWNTKSSRPVGKILLPSPKRWLKILCFQERRGEFISLFDRQQNSSSKNFEYDDRFSSEYADQTHALKIASNLSLLYALHVSCRAVSVLALQPC